MKGVELISTEVWKPLEQFGLTHKFFHLEKSIIINTWIALSILFFVAIIIRIALRRPHSIGRFFIVSGIAGAMEFVEETLNEFSLNHFVFVGSIFVFIVTCNLSAIIPFMEEPTKDINTTLALGIISFIYVQSYSIKAHGIREYLKEFLVPFFLMAPLHIIGKLATIVSISFRLFGNIFGGSIISTLYLNLIQKSILLEFAGIISGLNLLVISFFGIFEAFLQAFVFTMLTLTYLALGTQHEEEETHKEKA
jgi:F-type H+-transporting ATPase subunit a